MMQRPKDSKELERMIIEHPMRVCLHMRLGMLDKINKNGEDMMRAIGMAVDGVMYLALCIMLAIVHMIMLIFYPYFIVRKFMMLRKLILNNQECMHFSSQGKPENEE